MVEWRLGGECVFLSETETHSLPFRALQISHLVTRL